jgi:hypothetical protein
MATPESMTGLCTACGRTSPAGLSHCGYCGRPFSPAPLSGRPLAEAAPHERNGTNTLAQATPSNGDRMSCPSCGASQPADHTYCSACGVRLAPTIIESNTSMFKRPHVPLVHSRLVVTNGTRAEPDRRTWGDRLARLYFNISLVVLIGIVGMRSGIVPAWLVERVREQAGALAIHWPALPSWLARADETGRVGVAEAPPDAAGSDRGPDGTSGPATSPTVLMRAAGSYKPDKDIQILGYRIERDGNQIVAIGELQNTSTNDAVNVVVTFTFRNASGDAVDLAKTEIGLLVAGGRRAWKVAVPYRPSITSGELNVEWVSRAPRQ